MEVLKPQQYTCTNVGATVVLTIGKKQISMDHHTAMRLAAFLYHTGKQAKREHGDMSKRIIGLGTLTDANLDELKAQRRRDGTVTFLR